MVTDRHGIYPADFNDGNDSAPERPWLTISDLDRPVNTTDIELIISNCTHITQRWLEMGWLMLKNSNYKIEDVKRTIMKDFEYYSDSAKIIHLTELWQRLNKDRATSRALVDICCHPTVGGVRDQIEELLTYGSSSHNGVPGIVGLIFTTLSIINFLGLDLDCVIKAVVKVAAAQWRSIGLEMDYSNGQLNSLAEGAPNHSSKLEMIIHKKADAIGKARAAQLLLDICKRLPWPVYGAVMDDLKKCNEY